MNLEIERIEYDRDCDHPLCETLHDRFTGGLNHTVVDIFWRVVEVDGPWVDDDWYRTKREAVTAMRGYVTATPVALNK